MPASGQGRAGCLSENVLFILTVKYYSLRQGFYPAKGYWKLLFRSSYVEDREVNGHSSYRP